MYVRVNESCTRWTVPIQYIYSISGIVRTYLSEKQKLKVYPRLDRVLKRQTFDDRWEDKVKMETQM